MEFTRDYLDGLIAGKVEESSSLEYKAAAALDRGDDRKKIELTKDVSAFANAGGGVLIYGIKCFRDFADAMPKIDLRFDVASSLLPVEMDLRRRE